MMAVDPDNEWEIETNEIETAASKMTTSEEQIAKVEEAAPEPAGVNAKEEKKEVKVRRSKRGYMILEFERNFGVMARQLQDEPIESENQDPVAGDKTKRGPPEAGNASKAAPTKPDKKLEELRKAAALRFKEKGPAWGYGAGGVKKQKLSPIKEELKQKSETKGK